MKYFVFCCCRSFSPINLYPLCGAEQAKKALVRRVFFFVFSSFIRSNYTTADKFTPITSGEYKINDKMTACPHNPFYSTVFIERVPITTAPPLPRTPPTPGPIGLPNLNATPSPGPGALSFVPLDVFGNMLRHVLMPKTPFIIFILFCCFVLCTEADAVWGSGDLESAYRSEYGRWIFLIRISYFYIHFVFVFMIFFLYCSHTHLERRSILYFLLPSFCVCRCFTFSVWSAFARSLARTRAHMPGPGVLCRVPIQRYSISRPKAFQHRIRPKTMRRIVLTVSC